MAWKDQRVMLIDTSRCIGCKACVVACKQWHQLGAETTAFTGSYQIPPDLSGNNLTYVKFTESTTAEGPGMFEGMKWLFFKDQCRHCFRPKCARACPTGVSTTSEGFVLFNSNCKDANLRPRKKKVGGSLVPMTFAEHCPYNIPRFSPALDQYVKCDFCYDRFASSDPHLNTTTACEAACPAGAIVTGSYTSIFDLGGSNSEARKRLKAAKRTHPLAKIIGGKYGRAKVYYLLTDLPEVFGY
ncbi:MAG: 4Fe-4S dicluster domain-containing protein [Nitrospirota bacterium]